MRADPSHKYAIKSMKKHEIIQSKHVDHIENEKVILGKLDHPFAVSVLCFLNYVTLMLTFVEYGK